MIQVATMTPDYAYTHVVHKEWFRIVPAFPDDGFPFSLCVSVLHYYCSMYGVVKENLKLAECSLSL